MFTRPCRSVNYIRADGGCRRMGNNKEDRMLAQKLIRTLFGVTLVGVLATSSIGAIPNANRTTHFTFSKAVQLPGVALPAGSYVFEVVNPETGGSVVRVASRDRSKTYLTQITLPVVRPQSRDMQPRIVLGESPAGQPPQVTSWFPDGEMLGHAFIY